MPRLRRLSGLEVVKLLESFGFEVFSIKGSHYKMRRLLDGQKQTLHVPVHGKSPIPTGTLQSIYRDALKYIAEDALRAQFYTD